MCPPLLPKFTVRVVRFTDVINVCINVYKKILINAFVIFVNVFILIRYIKCRKKFLSYRNKNLANKKLQKRNSQNS